MPTRTSSWYGDPLPSPTLPAAPNPSVGVASGILDYFRASDEQGRGEALNLAGTLAGNVSNPSLPGYTKTAPTVGMSPDGSFYVQGQTIKPGDYESQVNAEAALNQPRQGQLPAGYQELTPEMYRQYVAQVKNPGTLELAGKSLGMGVDQTGQSLGRAIQTAGVGFGSPGLEQMGRSMADRSTEELRMVSPYSRPWGTSSLGDFTIGMLGSTLPRMAAGAAGGLAGSLVGPEGTMTGAAIGAGLVNYPLAVGDVAQRQMEVNKRIDPGAAAGWGVPYAAADVLTEYLPFGQALGHFGLHGIEPILGAGVRGAAKSIGKRIVVGGLESAGAEAVGEGSQEAFQRAGAGQSLNDAAAWQAYAENAAGGAFLGGLMGGAGRLFARAPAQTGEPLPPDAPADLLNQPSQQRLALPAPEGQQGQLLLPPPSQFGRSDTGEGGPPLLPPPTPPGGLPGPGLRLGLPAPTGTTPWLVGPNGQVVTGGEAPRHGAPPIREITGPGVFDLFGQPGLYTDPGQRAPTPVAPTGIGPAEFYNQTPMGQHIANQLVSEYTGDTAAMQARQQQAAAGAQGGTMAEQLAALTGRGTPEAQRADTANAAIALAGQTAFEEGQAPPLNPPAGPPGTGTAIDLRARFGSAGEPPVPPAPPAAPAGAAGGRLRRGSGGVLATTPAGVVPETTTHTQASLRDAAKALPNTVPPKVRSRLHGQINFAKTPAKLNAIAAEIAQYTPEKPAATQPVTQARALVPAGASGELMGFGTTEEPAKPLQITDTKVRLSRTEGQHTEVGLSDGSQIVIYKDKDSGTWQIDLAKSDLPKGVDTELTGGNRKDALAALPAKIAQLRSGAPVETKPVPVAGIKGKALTRQERAAARAPAGQTTETQAAVIEQAHERTGYRYAGLAEDENISEPARLEKQIESLPDTAPERTVAAAYAYIDQGNYGHAQMMIDAARMGRDIEHFALTEEERAAQAEKINARPEQKSADADIEAGVDPERAKLESALNRLATGDPKTKKAAKLGPRVVSQLKGYFKNANLSIKNLRGLIVQALENAGHNEQSLTSALGRRENLQAEAEKVGEDAYKVTPEKLADAADQLNEHFNGKTGAAAQEAEAQVQASEKPETPGVTRMPIFKREDEAAFVSNGMTKEDVTAEVEKVTKGWTRAPGVDVYENHAAIPGEYKGPDGVTPTSKGFFDRATGRVGIIAANIADAADARATVYHEALAHFGLWNRFTTRLSKMLVDMYNTNSTVSKEADKFLTQKGLEKNPVNIARAVEETLAVWFEPGVVKTSAWQKMVAYVRNIGRGMGMVHTYTDNDVASVMHKAQQYTMRENGPVTYMEHMDAATPEVLLRDWTADQTIKDGPGWIKDNARVMADAGKDSLKNRASKVMLTNQQLDDFLPMLGATLAKNVASLVRFRDTMTNTLMKGAREWAAGMEKQSLAFRTRSKGIGEPALDNFSGFMEASRRRNKFGFIPEDGRFDHTDPAVLERFQRGKFKANGEQVAGEAGEPLLDPELVAAFQKFTPGEQQAIRKASFELYNIRSMERDTLSSLLRENHTATKTTVDERVSQLEHDLGVAQETEGYDKTKLRKLERAHEDAMTRQDDMETSFTKAMRDLHNVYRDMEYVPYAPMQRHGKYVVVAQSKALQAAREAQRAGVERGEGEPSTYAMETDPDHYFVHAVDSISDAKYLIAKLKTDSAFAGTEPVYHETTKPGEELFKGSDVIAGLHKIIGNIGSTGDTSAINNTMLMLAQRTIIEAMSQNSARKADLHFRNIRSAPLDMPKAIMSRMLSSAQFLSAQKYSTKLNHALNAASEQIKDPRAVPPKHHAAATAAFNDFIARYNDDLTPKSEDTMADKLSGMASIWMLMGSPSYYAQQVAQNMMITAPYLSGRFGVAATTKAFKNGYAQVNKAFTDTGEGSYAKGVASYLSNGMLDISKVDPKYREVLRYAESLNLLDVSMNLEMGRVSSDVSSGIVDKAMRGVRNSVRGVEAGNRISAMVAAYDLMESQGRVTPETISNLLGVDQAAFDGRYADYLDNHATIAGISDREKADLPPVMSKDQFAAAEYARQVVLDTHGDYSSSNKPVWTRRGLWRVATQFRTFNAMMLGTYAKTFHRAFLNKDMSKAERMVAMRTLAYMTGSTALFAGAAGLPGAALMGSLYAMVMGGGSEPPDDYQKDLREAVGDPYLANILLYGAPSLFGLNMSGSMGMGSLFSLAPSADAPTDAASYQKYALALFGGPSVGGLGVKAFDALDLWHNKGQTYKAMEALLPRALLGPTRAIHDSIYGSFDRKGYQIVKPEDISMAEKVWGAAGFQSSDRSARQWSRERAFTESEFYSSTGASIKRDFTDAKAAGDTKSMADARTEWQALQATRSQFGFKQQPMSQLLTAPTQKAKQEKDTIGGIAYTSGSKGEALKLGRLVGAQ